MSISAITGAQLVKNGVTDVQSALQGVPGVAFVTAGPGKTVFNIRGLSSSGGAAATVGFYLDETPISSPAHSTGGKTAIDPDIYDIAQVEVLRGPQGTLYGASAMGGTIKLQTSQPRLGVIEGSAHAGFGAPATGGASYVLDGMVNVPLVGDKVALRLVATQRYDNGYVDRIVNPGFPAGGGATRGDVTSGPQTIASTRGGDNSVFALRGALLVKPTDDLSITASIFRQREHENDQGLIDLPPGNLAHYQPANVAEPSRDDFTLYSLVAKYDFGVAELQSSSSWLQRSTMQQEDETEVDATLFAGLYPAGVNFIPAAIIETHPEHAFTEELRLTSRGHTRLEWQVGGFYSSFSDSYVASEQVDAFVGVPDLGTSDVLHYNELDQVRQVAAFGQATFHMTPKLSVTGGLRWFYYRNTFSEVQDGIVAGLSPASGTETHSGVTPKFDVRYQFTPNQMVYATISKGFRPGGANVPVPITGPASCAANLGAIGINGEPGAYGPDSLWNYEIGVKGSAFNRALSVHGSAFYIDWQHVQQQVVLACGYNITQNEGKAVSKGFDLDFNARLGEHVRIGGGGGYTDATLQQNTASGGIAGQQLQNVPKWTYNLEGEYNAKIRDYMGDPEFFAMISYKYIGSSHDALGYKPDYRTVGIRTGLDFGRFRVAAFVNNLFNVRPILSYANDLGVNIPTLLRAATLRPRTIGMDVNVKF